MFRLLIFAWSINSNHQTTFVVHNNWNISGKLSEDPEEEFIVNAIQIIKDIWDYLVSRSLVQSIQSSGGPDATKKVKTLPC